MKDAYIHLQKFLKKQSSKAKQLAAVKESGLNVRRISNPDKGLQLEAVKQDGFSIQFIHDPDKDVQLEAVKKDGWSIQFIHNPDKDMRLEAVKQDGYSIIHIHNPDKGIQLEAIKQNGSSIIWCPELFPELLAAYLSSKECPEELKQKICDPKWSPNEVFCLAAKRRKG